MKTYILRDEIWKAEVLGKFKPVQQRPHFYRNGPVFFAIDDLLHYITDASAETFPSTIAKPTEYTAYFNIFDDTLPDGGFVDTLQCTCSPSSNDITITLASTTLL